MRIICAPLRFRGNTETQDNANAFAIRLAKDHFDAVMFCLPSWNECPAPLLDPIFQYALAMAVEAKLEIIVCRSVWDAWDESYSRDDTPMEAEWHRLAIGDVKALASAINARLKVPVYHALDGEPMGGKCPQKWLRDNWDEGKREAVTGAIREAVFQSGGPVHYVMPSTTEGKGKSRYAPSIAELGMKRICWQTYAMYYDGDHGLWPEPRYWAPPGHAARRDVRGLWVSAALNGIATLRDRSTKQVLTVEQALSCREDSFWYTQDVPGVLGMLKDYDEQRNAPHLAQGS